MGAGALGLAAAIGCTSREDKKMSHVTHRPQHTLPSTELAWLKLHDHFIATVGPRSGEGKPLGPLLVLADATFAPHSRFPLHPHRDMEILSIVVDGELSHHGDQAHASVVREREAQLISSRNGIVHAEGNELDRPTRMLQIWFAPNERCGTPAYGQRQIAPRDAVGNYIVAGDAELPMRCDAKVWWLGLEPGRGVELDVAAGRAGYLLALTGSVRAGGVTLAQGDGLEAIAGALVVEADAAVAALWIDVAI